MSIPVKKVLEVSPTLRSIYSNGMDRDVSQKTKDLFGKMRNYERLYDATSMFWKNEKL